MAKFELLEDEQPPPEGSFAAMPDPMQYAGGKIRHKTGIIYESDGNTWRQIPQDGVAKKLASDTKEMLSGAARGLTTDLLGAPVDIMSTALRGVGFPIPSSPVLGSSHLRRLTNQPQTDSPEAQVGNIASGLINPLLAGLKGAALAGTFFNVTPRTAEKIKELQQLGKSKDEIFAATKAFPSSTGTAHRVELSDDLARFNSLAAKKLTEGSPISGRMKDFIQHDDLFNKGALGQQIKEMNINITRNPGALNGSFIPSGLIRKDAPIGTVEINAPPGSSHDDIIKTVLHEVQHAIQTKTGLPLGDNPKTILARLRSGKLNRQEQQIASDLKKDGESDEFIAHYIYKRSAGEIEARAVERRYKNPSKGSIPVYDVHSSKAITR